MASLSRLLLLDCETTGLEPGTAELCEIGAVLFSVPHRSVLQQLSFLLPVVTNPAEDVNGIAPALTLEEQPAVEARALFLAMVASADALVAHNAAFDRPWIDAWLSTTSKGDTRAQGKPWICTCEGISWEGIRPNPSLATLALAHGIPVWAAHRALTDCIYLAQILQRDPLLEEHLAEGLQPRQLVAADLPFSRKDEAKAAGFRWVPEAKQWQRRCTADQIEALPFAVIPLEDTP
ncbi:3'-5' exonuclease [Cyanobium sp. ATX 6A2]|uniref:exonuclease domain-containing protein n=1 Tax=Cyanobium sp. ATX 6A2 TaxID=2823700 RepID=UPI0020CEC9F0|nr:exonuclease domain-containing protein [Cyanobium sp. ATX 6A2]MCP9889064.1 3'-5' exonuclease [Cyanobium sp. ATX 6A2]